MDKDKIIQLLAEFGEANVLSVQSTYGSYYYKESYHVIFDHDREVTIFIPRRLNTITEFSHNDIDFTKGQDPRLKIMIRPYVDISEIVFALENGEGKYNDLLDRYGIAHP